LTDASARAGGPRSRLRPPHRAGTDFRPGARPARGGPGRCRHVLGRRRRHPARVKL